MKKIQSLKPAAIFIFAGLSLATILGSFWHYQTNQSRLSQMSLVNQGIMTCFGRLSQSFTAVMISDFQSPYIKQDFFNLSNECLSETTKTAQSIKTVMGKGFENLTQLNSETTWFHERIGKMKTASDLAVGMTPISERYSRMENYKQTLTDEIDAASVMIRKVQTNNEALMGVGLIMFVIALSVLSLQEFQRYEAKKKIEKDALNYLTTKGEDVGAIVDKLVEAALQTQNMPVTAQVFSDYHGIILERQASVVSVDNTFTSESTEDVEIPVESKEEVIETRERSSLKETLVTLQNIHSKENLQIAELRDVQILGNNEGMELMLNAAVNALISKRTDSRKIMVGTQVHSDRVILNFFCGGNIFNAPELEYGSNTSVVTEGVDTNLQILKEMVQLAEAQWFVENKMDRQGKITGMNIRLVVERALKETRSKSLVSITKGKKKDLAKAMSH